LITGANKGLGREAARRLIELGHTVYVGGRYLARITQTADELGGRPLLIDVTDDASVAAAADQLEELDVLVNSAGIPGGRIPPGETTAADLLPVYDTTVFGIVRVMLPKLTAGATGVVVNVSSGLGSLSVTNDPDQFESTLPGLAYPSSKAAVNILTSQYAKSYPQLRINVVDPGYTATDLNGNRGIQTLEEGTEIIVAMAQVAADGPTGKFFDRHGPAAW
jgi:NAD(P)-dependent dehydrogenase (short-subunit alcohol dehydrogenase family)